MSKSLTLFFTLLLLCSQAMGNSGVDLTGISIHNCLGDIYLTAQSGQNGATAYWQVPTASTTCQISSGPDCSGVSNNISGFIYMGEYNGSKYYCSDSNSFSWSSAKNKATNNGGYLVSINSSGENNFIGNNIIANTAWLGINDAAYEGQFVWQNGDPVTYTNWDSGEPNNLNNSDYGVILQGSNKWRDREGSDHYEFVMEKSCPTPQSPGSVSISQTAGPSSGSFFSVGTTTVTYTAVDDCGETKTCSFTVTVNAAPAPCASQGGDYDGDGVCANQDCNDYDASVPAAPGTACNDGNSNTQNDVIQSDGCTCAGTPTSNPCEDNVTISTSNGKITVSGLDGAAVTSLQIFNSSWGTTYSCSGSCNATEMVNVSAGTYHVYVKYYTAGWQPICQTNETVTVTGGDPCANAGGDTDNDGICNDNDNCPDNYNPGQTDSDGDGIGDDCEPQNTDILPASNHPKFVNQLPSIPRINAKNGGNYQLGMEQSDQWLGLVDANHTPVQTSVWGYTFNGNQMYLGPTFETKKDQAVNVKWINNLPFNHLLPVDESIHKADPSYGIPTVVHLHGAHVESASDGGPDSWFTQNFAEKGTEWVKETLHYTNDQEAAPLWYHDHTLGMTRLNVYAGLAGMYLIRDDNELSMDLPTGNYEKELVIQDKQFSSDGSLYFPALLSDPEAQDFPTNPSIEPTIFPEFFGDYIIVNGSTWPKLDVEATKYRFRLLNASDSRFYIFKFSNGASFQQIGTDGGLLNNPVTLNELVLAPGERADIVVDFSGMQGQSITLINTGPDEPFKGLTANQTPADPNTTGCIMRFNVQNYANAYFSVPYNLRQEAIQSYGQEENTRQLLLLEGMDQYGRLKPSLGTAQDGVLGYTSPITENPNINTTEIWEVYNMTEDAHPIHIHQISFELVNRQEFTGDLDPNTSALSNIQMVGAPLAPAPNERGWKDTYIVPPGQVARFKVRFDIPGKYVWHCHILSHEDWDMMRPFEVISADSCAVQGGDNDGDGVCANQDCNDWDASVPAAPGTTCNDGNPNTTNDVIQADGCSCAGTPIGNPDCNTDINISSANGQITVTGLDGAPVSSLQIFNSTWQTEFSCAGNCNPTETINVPPGTYYVYAKYYTATWGFICENSKTVTVTGGDPCAGQGGDYDGDGVCANQDCNDYNPAVPAAPSTPCDDGNPNTNNDVIQGDSCTCAGTPVNPCASQGGDYDGDGVCANQDCNDYDASVPTAPGTACNDGNPNTQNDVIQSDGCTCAGTPTNTPCDNVSIATSDGKITVTGLNGSPVSQLQIFNSNWQEQYQCAGNCNDMEMVNVSAGTYYVYVKFYTASWQPICSTNETVTVTGGDPCANQGGDSDGDGVCNDQDNCDFTYNPGQADSDGDGQGDACDTDPNCSPVTLAKWNLEACYSNTGNNSGMDYSEFTPSYPNSGNCIDVDASTIYRNEGAHSCTPGYDGNVGMCIGTRSDCNFVNNDPYALRFEVTLSPGDVGKLSTLTFYEKAPTHYVWIGGDSGSNNYPTKYGIRVLKNGHEIYKQTGINTTRDWTFESFDFSNDSDFEVTSTSTFTFELRAYCRIGNGASQSVWDIDHFKIKGCCTGSAPRRADIFAFHAAKGAQSVDLNWTINSDDLTDTYIIERSDNGIDFEEIDRNVSAYNTTEAVNYTTKDFTPVAGDNFYRIKQIFTNGTFRYSFVEKIIFEGSTDKLLLYPNPTSDHLYLGVKEYIGSSGTIQIYNSIGVLLQEKTIAKFTAAPIGMEVSQYRAGVYALTLRIDGRQQVTKLFTVIQP